MATNKSDKSWNAENSLSTGEYFFFDILHFLDA